MKKQKHYMKMLSYKALHRKRYLNPADLVAIAEKHEIELPELRNEWRFSEFFNPRRKR